MVAVVGVGAGDPDAATWLNGLGVTFPAVADTTWTITNQYWNPASGSYPQNVIIGRDEIVQNSITGLHDEATLEGYLLDVIWMRDPVNLEMVMDVSDTMNSPSPPHPAGDTRLTMMKLACTMITDFLHDHGQANDKMGLVWFTDNASEYTHPVSGEKLVPIIANTTDLKAEINAHTTGICTAMGAGLQKAFNTLMTKPDHRFAILCTDGMQNIEPKVTAVGGHFEIIDSGGWLCGVHSSTPPCPGDNITLYNTRVHTIGIGIEASYAALLQDVANATGGFYIGTDDPATDLDLIYFVDLCNCLAGGSPSIVLHSPSRLNAEQCTTEEHFNLNRTTRKITVMLSWEKVLNGNLTFWLYAPDGTLLDLYREMQFFDNYVKATIYLPKLQEGKTIPYVGQWHMVIAGQFSGQYADYHAIVIAEDPEVHYKLVYPKKGYSVGDILPLRIQVEEKQKPITEVREIVMETAHLRVPLQELLAEYKISQYELSSGAQTLSKESLCDPLAAKLGAMEADKRFRELLKPVREQLSLRKGTLKYELKEKEILIPIELKQSGLHTFKVVTNMETAGNGPIQRVSMVSVMVDPGKADPKHTTITVSRFSAGKKTGIMMRITPRNSQGQLLGPEYSKDFSVFIGKKALKYEVEDLVDGTYQVKFFIPASAKKEKKTKISVFFRDTIIWEGAV